MPEAQFPGYNDTPPVFRVASQLNAVHSKGIECKVN